MPASTNEQVVSEDLICEVIRLVELALPGSWCEDLGMDDGRYCVHVDKAVPGWRLSFFVPLDAESSVWHVHHLHLGVRHTKDMIRDLPFKPRDIKNPEAIAKGIIKYVKRFPRIIPWLKAEAA